MLWDFKNDSVMVGGSKIKLRRSLSGQFLLPLSMWLGSNAATFLAVGDEPQKVASKLHKQFGHVSADKLIKLVKCSDYFTTELQEINRVSEKCEICVKFKKPPPKPTVSIQLASRLNETVSMDLKFWKGIYFLVIIDIALDFMLLVK